MKFNKLCDKIDLQVGFSFFSSIFSLYFCSFSSLTQSCSCIYSSFYFLNQIKHLKKRRKRKHLASKTLNTFARVFSILCYFFLLSINRNIFYYVKIKRNIFVCVAVKYNFTGISISR